METFDTIIIGAGPIGMACGIAAQQNGLRYLILEKGCLVNSIYHYPAHMTFFSTSEKIEIGEVPFVSHTPKPTRREALEYYRRVKETWGLAIHTYESVDGFSPQGREWLVRTQKGQYRTRSIIIATGFYDHPNKLGVPGEDLPKVKHYYDEPHPYLDQDVLVVGAANSAIDVALEVWRKGGRVSLVHRGPEISHRVKYWVRPDIENRIKEGAIPAYFNSQIAAVREDAVDIATPDGIKTLKNDFILAMTGYKPDYEWLIRNGIAISADEARLPHRNPETFESNLSGVYLAGTVCGGMNTNKWFIENSIDHGARIIAHIKQQEETKDRQ